MINPGLLFLIYKNDVRNIVPKHLTTFFADDTYVVVTVPKYIEILTKEVALSLGAFKTNFAITP